jgi:hypothetical protein
VGWEQPAAGPRPGYERPDRPNDIGDEFLLDSLISVAREVARSYPDDPICEAVLEAERALKSLRGVLGTNWLRNKFGEVERSRAEYMRQLKEEDRVEVQRKAREEAASA